MDDTTKQSTADLEAQHAALSQAIAVRREQETAASHFVDSDGNRFTDPVAINDAMLRAMGGAMEKRASEMNWMNSTPQKLADDLASAVRAEDYVAVGCYAGMLYASSLQND